MQPIRPQRHPVRRTVIIIVAVVGVLCLCAGGVAFGAYRFLSSASAEPRAAVHAFVADLAAGDADAAYGKLCAKTRAEYPVADFTSAVRSQPRPAKVKINGFSIQNGTAQVDSTLTYADGHLAPHAFSLVKEGDVWLICGNPY